MHLNLGRITDMHDWQSLSPELIPMMRAWRAIIRLPVDQERWLHQHGMPTQDLVGRYSIEQQIAYRAALHSDCPQVVRAIYTWNQGSLDQTPVVSLQSLLPDAIRNGSTRTIGYLLTQAEKMGPAQWTIAPETAQECLDAIMLKDWHDTREQDIQIAFKMGAQRRLQHDRNLMRALGSGAEALQAYLREEDIAPDCATKLFRAAMIDPTRDDLDRVPYVIWEECFQEIDPSGIFAEVDTQLPKTQSKQLGSRWQLAMQVDPEAACRISSKEFHLDATLIQLMDCGLDALTTFLQLFPTETCPFIPDDFVTLGEPQGHHLDLFANHSLAMTHVACSYLFVPNEQVVPMTQAIVQASQRNKVAHGGSYHLVDQTLLIVDSCVEVRNRCGQEQLPNVPYYNLDVVGFDLESRICLAPDQLEEACRICPTLLPLIWNKQLAKHAQELQANSAQH